MLDQEIVNDEEKHIKTGKNNVKCGIERKKMHKG